MREFRVGRMSEWGRGIGNRMEKKREQGAEDKEVEG